MIIRIKKVTRSEEEDLISFVFEREDKAIVTCDRKISGLKKTWKFLVEGLYVKNITLIKPGIVNPKCDITIVAPGMERVAEVIRIDPARKSRNGDTSYIRVCFRLWGETDEFAKTDVCGRFRNRPKWDEIIKKGVGTKIIGWVLMPNKKPQTINADSNIKIL